MPTDKDPFRRRTLVDRAQCRLEGAVLLVAEKRRRLGELHAVDERTAFRVSQLDRTRPRLWLAHRLVVIGVQKVKRRRIRLYDIQDLFRVQSVRHALHHLDGLSELTQTHFVDSRALEQIVPEHGRRPSAKLDASLRLHAIANRNHDVEVVEEDILELRPPFHRTVTSGMCKICTYHFLIDFTFLYRISDMPPDNRPIFPEQVCHLSLREPDGLALQRHGQADLSVFRLEQHKLVLLVHLSALSLCRFGIGSVTMYINSIPYREGSR